MTIRRRSLRIAPLIMFVVLLCACSSNSSSNSATTTPPPVPILETIGRDANLISFGTAVSLTDLKTTLAGAGPYTVFAPTNKALVLADGTLGDPSQPEAKARLAALLSYHVVPGALMASDLQPGTLTTLNGETLTVSVSGSDIVLTDAQGGQAKIVEKDLVASNGVVFMIDSTLLPTKK